jgi:hypothetical protein
MLGSESTFGFDDWLRQMRDMANTDAHHAFVRSICLVVDYTRGMPTASSGHGPGQAPSCKGHGFHPP